MSLDKISVLLADNLHFHERNFKSLFDFFNSNKIKYQYATSDKSWLSLYGNYGPKRNHLRTYYDLLIMLNCSDLYNFNVRGYNVYELARSELLSFLIPQEEWLHERITYDFNLFSKIYKNNKDALILNMAAVCYWFDFWDNYLNTNKVFTYCCIFSGCLIYTKVLLKCLETRVTNPFIFESSFTGDDYYCEFQYNCIPNNSIISYKNYYENMIDGMNYDSKFSLYKDENQAINKIRLMKNKNVEQPIESEDIFFKNSNKNILILGQVINDFSILESNLEQYNSLIFYKDLIIKILSETNLNIIFKAHPWETKKINIYRSLTKDSLDSFIQELEPSYKDRIKVVENYNIYKLFSNCSHVLTLCSQGAIEAAYYGLKPIQMGNAFYGNKGFTFDVNSFEDAIFILNNQSGLLGLKEFNNFKKFLINFLLNHLISIHNSGFINLLKLFTKVETSELVKSDSFNSKEVNKVVKSDIAEINVKGQIKVDNLEPKIKNIVAPPKEKVIHPIDHSKRIFDNKLNSAIQLNKLEKKLNKLKYQPDKFFKDSKFLFIRKFGHIYSAFKQK